MKKRIENISSLIEGWCKKKLVFARPLLPFGTVGVADAHCTHLQIAQAAPQTKICKRVQFLPSHNALLKISAILILTFTFLSIHAQDSYVSTADLNMRNGAGKNYKSIVVLSKGDTVTLLDNSGDYWAKIQYHDKVGYSAKQYLQKIEIIEETKTESGNGFVVFLVCLIIIIVTSIILKKTGEKYRYKSTATVLSFFFGAFGFQKFYLGEKNKGVYSILFCWTFIPSLIGLIDFIKLAVMKEKKFNDLYNWGKRPTVKAKKEAQVPPKRQSSIKVKIGNEVISNQSKQNYVDETIIDVNSQNLDLSVEQNSDESTSHQQPPYWGHTYVYSYDEIKHATKAQKQFYAYFKNQVANGKYIDIQGNTNYAFILYFDFLNEYENHRDIKLLDEQFKLLGEICPKTRSYSLRSLQDELRKRNDAYSVDKLKDLEEPTYQFEHGYSDYNPDLYKLGNQYKDKLGLNKQEIRWLNKFYNPTNVFLSIEGCCIATAMQYVTLLKELEKQLKKKETTLAKEVTYFKEKLKAIYVKRNSDWGYYDSGYLGNQAESEVYLTMFKRVENSVRESFGHKRKVSGDFPYADKNLSEEFETKLGNSLNGLIEVLKDNVGKPNLETQIELNAQNVNRWRIGLDELIVAFKKENIDNFVDGVIHLEETNQKNPNIENIFYQASKFISKYDKVQSLKYYAKYIYYDLKSKKFDNKELTKTVQKSLFKTEEQINDFKKIIGDLIETNDIQTALEKISKIYIPKRKRIQLDRSEIQEVEQKHEGTVELLNEYLVDEKVKPETEISNENGEDIEIAIIDSEENNSVFISEISMGQVQEELVKMIINNSYEIHQDEVDKYATANGMFKNQLIDSINEACEEHLDGETLIEEDDENYIIEESYYKEIAK